LDNPYAHFTTTGPEIWQQSEQRIPISFQAWGPRAR
jgi:cysteine synthase